MGTSMKQETIGEAGKAMPAVGGTAYSFIEAAPLNELVAIATIIYIIVQTVILLHKHFYFVKEKKNGIS